MQLCATTNGTVMFSRSCFFFLVQVHGASHTVFVCHGMHAPDGGFSFPPIHGPDGRFPFSLRTLREPFTHNTYKNALCSPIHGPSCFRTSSLDLSRFPYCFFVSPSPVSPPIPICFYFLLPCSFFVSVVPPPFTLTSRFSPFCHLPSPLLFCFRFFFSTISNRIYVPSSFSPTLFLQADFSFLAPSGMAPWSVFP
jgi:hypothetical protein